jgi:hypothetical protein
MLAHRATRGAPLRAMACLSLHAGRPYSSDRRRQVDRRESAGTRIDGQTSIHRERGESRREMRHGSHKQSYGAVREADRVTAQSCDPPNNRIGTKGIAAKAVPQIRGRCAMKTNQFITHYDL